MGAYATGFRYALVFVDTGCPSELPYKIALTFDMVSCGTLNASRSPKTASICGEVRLAA